MERTPALAARAFIAENNAAIWKNAAQSIGCCVA